MASRTGTACLILTIMNLPDTHGKVIRRVVTMKLTGLITALLVTAQLSFAAHPEIKELVLGRMHSCVLANQVVRCWGENNKGQINVPLDLKNPRGLSAHYDYTCSITDEGIRCWGDNSEGFLSPPSNLNNVSQLFAGSSACAIYSTNQIACWGDSNGLEVDTYPKIPAELTKPKRFAINASMYGNSYHHCAIVDDGVACWGNNSSGQANVPTNLSNVSEVAVSHNHTCAIADNTVRCWGDSFYGGTKVPKNLKNPRNLMLDGSQTCVITDEGVKCWGGDLVYLRTFLPSLNKPQEFVSSGYRSCAITESGVRCSSQKPWLDPHEYDEADRVPVDLTW
jgi:hypothetical protein